MEQENSALEYEFNTSLYNVYGFNTTSTSSIEEVKRWLNDPMTYNKEIRDLSRRMYSSNGLYSNVVDYIVGLPLLHYIIYGKSDGKGYEQGHRKFKDALDKIKHKTWIRSIIHKLAIDGIYFGYTMVKETGVANKAFSDMEIREVSLNATDFNLEVMELPTDFCRIVGMKNSSYQIAFDMGYFDYYTSNGRSTLLKRYPSEIIKAYKAYKSDSNKKWAVLDNDKTVVIKIRSDRYEELWGRPVGLSAVLTMLFDSYLLETKNNTLDNLNSELIFQEFPEGEKKGQSSLNKAQQEMQHNNIKNAIFSRKQNGVNFMSVASGTKINRLDLNTEVLNADNESQVMERIATELGFSSSLLGNGNASGSYSGQQGNLELIGRQVLSWVEELEYELNKVINKNVINRPSLNLKVYYLPVTLANQDKFFANMKDLYTVCGGSLLMTIAGSGIEVEPYMSVLDYEKANGFDEKYLPHQTSFTVSGSDGDTGGRPESDNPSDSTMDNKTAGTDTYSRTDT